MKKMLIILLPVFLIFSCSDKKAESETVTGDSVVTTNNNDRSGENLNLPYTVAKTPDWERGDNNNVAIAMNTLRAFEVNDMAGIGQYLADSIEFYIDNISFEGSRDSLIKMFTGYRNSMDTLHVKMLDYESVKSKNRGEEWVGLWYIETTKQKGGKLDSAMVMDDIKIVNGKVALIDSKMRRMVKRK